MIDLIDGRFVLNFFPHLCSVFGWDHVTQGLVQLGFFLMDTFGPKPGPFGKTTEGSAGVARTPTQLACKLGGQVLLQGFKVTLGLYSIDIICV